MRFLVAVLCAIAVLALTWLYQSTLADAPTLMRPEVIEETTATYRLKITSTFDAGVDPFAEEVEKATSLRVSLRGKEVFSLNRPIPAGETMESDVPLELQDGVNELLVEMTPADTLSQAPKAIHVELFENDLQQAKQSVTIWAPSGDSIVVGRVPFDVDIEASNRGEQE